jgi:hypothetical protein
LNSEGNSGVDQFGGEISSKSLQSGSDGCSISSALACPSELEGSTALPMGDGPLTSPYSLFFSNSGVQN